MTIRDDCLSVRPGSAALAAFSILDATQDKRPAEQITGAALNLLIWCKRYGVDPREILGISAQLFRDGLTSQNQHVWALKHFMKVDVQDPYSFTF